MYNIETRPVRQSNWIECDNKLICLETGTIIYIDHFEYKEKHNIFDKFLGLTDKEINDLEINDFDLTINREIIKTFATQQEAQAEYDRIKKILIGE